MMKKKDTITLGITGASGAIYGLNLLKYLTEHYEKIYLVISDAGRIVIETELNIALPASPSVIKKRLSEFCEISEISFSVFSKDNWFSPIASGSSAPKQMLICPASMGCISAIANGASNHLLERAADVILKEKGELILLPREMPFSQIHLENLLRLSKVGATIMPISPGFYHRPTQIQDLVNFVSARVFAHLGIEHTFFKPWGYQKSSSISEKENE
jgi:4-hydroxy-3-polyprenylbenzoate decarboxylase